MLCTTCWQFALLAATVICGDAVSVDPSLPHLSGVFLAIDDVTAARSSWRADLQAMVDVGIEFLVVRSTAKGVSYHGENDTAAGCPLGRFQTYFPVSNGSALAKCTTRQQGNNTVRTILSDAAALGLGVHLGLAYPESSANAAQRNANATKYFRDYAWLQWATAQDLWAQYGAEFNGTIRGFYTDLEESNTVGYLELAQPLAQHLLQPLAQDMHAQLRNSLLVWASPYFVGNLTRHEPTSIMNPGFYADFWGQLMDWSPDFGLIAPQDSMGAQGNSFQNVSDYLDAMAAVSHAHKLPIWSNVELFEVWPRSCQWPQQCHGRHPAPFERIKAQLANEAPRADALIAWEWESCLSPLHSNDTARLYAQYRAYVLGG